MNNELLIRMAQRASEDDELLASAISRFARDEGLDWNQVANRLRIDPVALAELALCRRPRAKLFVEDIADVADYVGISRRVLADLVRHDEVLESRPSGPPAWLVLLWDTARTFFESNRGTWDAMSRWSWAWAAAGVVAVVIVAAALGARPEPVEVMLVVSEGQANVEQARNVVFMIPTRRSVTVSAGDELALRTNDSVSMGMASEAQLRFSDGTTVDLADGASLEMEKLQVGDVGDPYRVELHQVSGRTVNRVQRQMGEEDYFIVSTPSSTASVRSTGFEVLVVSPDITFVAVNEGVVTVELEGKTVELRGGQEIRTTIGEPLQVGPRGDVTTPTLTLFHPDDLPAPGEVVTVSGATEAGATVTVSGLPVMVDVDGTFETKIIVGSEPIIIEATDEAGNTTTVRIE
jgi:anti-sigma-K factor RskA